MARMYRSLSEELYDELCNVLTDFKNATDDDENPDWLSDGEWLDVFYDLCVKMQNSMCM